MQFCNLVLSFDNMNIYLYLIAPFILSLLLGTAYWILHPYGFGSHNECMFKGNVSMQDLHTW